MARLSNYLEADFLVDFMSNLPRRIKTQPGFTEAACKSAIKAAMTRYNNFVISNDLGLFNTTAQFDFYLNNPGLIINSKSGDETETRWFKITPDPANNFFARKLLSCQLQLMLPDSVEFPEGIAFVQDIKISIADSKDVNITEPAANTGLCSLEENSSFLNALTFDKTNNTFLNVMQIKCLITYYRFIELPFPSTIQDATLKMDAAPSDFQLVMDYAEQILSEGAASYELLARIDKGEIERLRI